MVLDMAGNGTLRPFEGRHALVTGGTRRIGRAIALHLISQGAHVTIHTFRGSDRMDALKQEARHRGGTVRSLHGDLRSTADLDDLIDAIRHTIPQIDLLINNAAGFESTEAGSWTAEAFDRHMDLNARAVYRLCGCLGADMKRAGRGAIVNISCASATRPMQDYIPYSASKAAVSSLTKGFARALAPEVRVNAIAPGPILPPSGADALQGDAAAKSTLLGRYGDPQDIALAVHFLLLQPYVTGTVLAVDGGRTIA